jgi:KDO2-lipid IV(A) lauroyltransferase
MMRLRHILEYVGLRLGLWLLDRLSLAAAERLALRAARLWYALDGSRRRTARENIRRSGVSTDPAEIDRIARASFDHFATLVIESLKSDETLTGQNWQQHVDMQVDPETLAILKEPGLGVILVSGHLGNWEVAAQVVSILKPVVGITKKMSNPYSDRLIKRRKPRYRFRLVPMRDADVGRFLSVLKAGEILALLVDQYAKGQPVMVDFFGIPASTHPSPALLHLVTRKPICFGYCLRTGPMRFRFVAGKPLIFKPTGNREADVKAILLELNHLLEKAIRESPEQYVWAHRRWRDDPAASGGS